jgi:glycosyltransferase involved in cell wall biosynthesis
LLPEEAIVRIVIAVHGFPPTFAAGAELRAYRMARWLLSRGDEVGVICVESVDRPGEPTFLDDTLDDIPVRRLSLNFERAPSELRRGFNNPWIGGQVRHYLLGSGADVMHLISGYLMSASTLRAAQELDIPAVVTLTDFWFLCPRVTMWRANGSLCEGPDGSLKCARCLREQGRRYRLPAQVAPKLVDLAWQWLEQHPTAGRCLGLPEQLAAIEERQSVLRKALNSADVVICPSHFLRDLFVQNGVNPSRLMFVRQGVDLAGRDVVRRRGDNRGLRIGYMGQLARHKGVHVLLQAFRRIRNGTLVPELHVYGDSRQWPKYVSQLKHLCAGNERIVLAGRYERRRLWQVLAELDVIVVPSIWYENSPNTILEAFAAKVPVVASELGGMAELVKHEVNGLLFTAGDAESLANQLQRLVDDVGLLPRLRVGIEPVKSIEQEMQELVQVYQQVSSN